MPIYEYKCNSCGRISTVLVRSYTTPNALACSKCGRDDLRKLVSRFAVLKSEESRIESLADPGMLADVDENDPRSVAKWARRMSREIGEDLGNDFDEMIDQMEAGEMPDELADGVDSTPSFD
jgi:putative FmdB family regulatory protein